MNKTKNNCCTSFNIKGLNLYDANVQNKLALLAKQGDRNAKSLLYTGMYNFVYGAVKQLSPSPELIEDLLQEVFVKLFSSCLKSYDESKEGNFRSYAAYWILSAVNSYLNVNLVTFPYQVPANIGFEYRSGNKKNIEIVEELKNRKTLDTFKDSDGNDVDIFDVIPSIDNDIDNVLSDDYSGKLNNTVQSSTLSTRNKNILLRYYNLGKFKNYPYISIGELANEFNVSKQAMYADIKRSIRKLKNMSKCKKIQF